MQDAPTDLMKAMFNWVSYAPTIAEYRQALEELRQYKQELAWWVEVNEPQQWVIKIH